VSPNSECSRSKCGRIVQQAASLAQPSEHAVAAADADSELPDTLRAASLLLIGASGAAR